MTSVRFFAAIYVVLFHTSYAAGFVIPDGIARFIALGGTSVSFFFILSGYILAAVYLRNRATIDRERFWIARFARIYPVFILLLFVDLPYVLIDRAARYGWPASAWKTAANFGIEALLLHGWSPALNAINFPSWSLSDEAFFYLLFPFLGLWLWRLRVHAAILTGAILYFGTIFVGILLRKAGLSQDVSFDLPISRASEFFLGILTCRIQLRALSHPRSRALLNSAAPVLLALCISLFVLAGQYDLPVQNRLLMGILLAPLYICAIVALSSENTWINQLLSHKFVVLLGEASFGLYLVHIPLWHLLHLVNLDGGTKTKYVVYLSACIALSIASFHFLEGPLRLKILERAHRRDMEGTLRSSIAQ